MAGTGPADLHALAEDYLQACVEALDSIPGSPDLSPGVVGAPARAFIAAGTPAADCCPQLTVHAVPITEGGHASLNAATIHVNRITLIATLFRCAAPQDKNGNPPSAAEQEAVSEQLNADSWALWNYPYNKWCAKLLFEDCGDVLNWVLNQIAPSGGCVGRTLTVTVSLQGYTSEFGT